MSKTKTAARTGVDILAAIAADAAAVGITPELVGCSMEEFADRAFKSGDPRGYLAIYAPAAAATDTPADVALAPAETYAVPVEFEPTRPAAPPATILTVEASIPLSDADLSGGYISGHIEARLSREQGATLRRLFLALDAEGRKLKNGRRIANAADAVRWLLEHLGKMSG